MDLSAIALNGLQQASLQFDTAAARVSNLTTASDEPGPDLVDLSAVAVSMSAAHNNFDANIQVLKQANEMQRHTIDMLV